MMEDTSSPLFFGMIWAASHRLAALPVTTHTEPSRSITLLRKTAERSVFTVDVILSFSALWSMK